MQHILATASYRGIAVGIILLGLTFLGASHGLMITWLWPVGIAIIIAAMLFITFADMGRPTRFAGRVSNETPPVGWAHHDRRTTRHD